LIHGVEILSVHQVVVWQCKPRPRVDLEVDPVEPASIVGPKVFCLGSCHVQWNSKEIQHQHCYQHLSEAKLLRAIDQRSYVVRLREEYDAQLAQVGENE
jgi:hypothetical protein